MSGRIVFLGTAPLCLPFLEVLTADFDIPLIITQPDKPSGRQRSICYSCVKNFALEQRIPLIQPESLKDAAAARTLQAVEPDLGIVIAYGQWIPPTIFKIPRYKTINVHFSLLPAYRGAAPVQRAIQDGCTRTGVSIFELNARMDAGPIWTQFPVEISDCDTTETLWQRMSRRSAQVLKETVSLILSGTSRPVPQDESQASLAPMIAKEEGRVDWSMPAQDIFNKLRAFTPWPGVFFQLNDRCIKIISAKALDFPHHGRPGQIHALSGDSLDVYCGAHSLLKIQQIQPPGKNPMTPYCYSRGNPLGQTLG